MVKDLEDLNKSDEKKLQDKLIKTIDKGIHPSVSYFLQLVCSTIIAVLGLITNSTAVVIGAMIISPMIWPIVGVTLSIITTRRHLARKSASLLLSSIVVVLLISILVTLIVPTNGFSTEIQARTNPTLLDLFIALASSIIGITAIYHPKISSTTPGVAISISLLPPLAVSGIGIAFGSFDVFWGSFLLFAANTGAMVFAGVITLYFLKFRPRYKNEKKRLRIGFLVSLVFMGILSIPLTLYLKDTLKRTEIKELAKKTITHELSIISQDSRLETVNINFPSQGEEEINISAIVYIPEGEFLTNLQQNSLVDLLSDQIGNTINLELDVINTLTLRSEGDQENVKLSKEISTYLDNYFKELDQEIIIESSKISFNSPKWHQPDKDVSILLQIKLFDKEPITLSQKNELEEQIEEVINRNVSIDVEFIPVRRLSERNELDSLQIEIKELFSKEIELLDKNIEIENIDINNISSKDFESYEIKAKLYIPNKIELTLKEQNLLEERIKDQLGEKVDLHVYLQLIRLEEVNY